MAELHSSNGEEKDQQHVSNTSRYECSAEPCRQRRSPNRKTHLPPSPDGKAQPANQECRRRQYHPPPPSLSAGRRNYAHCGKAQSRHQTGDRTDRRCNEDGSHSMTLNGQHQRREPAATEGGIVSERDGWLPAAECCGLGL